MRLPVRSIRALTSDDLPHYRAHLERHRSESGCGDPFFMPFALDDPEGPKGVNGHALARSLNQRGWQRCFAAFTGEGDIVGHVDLKGDGLKVGLHRCELGIGIERPHRGGGLGKKLMEIAIEFAHESGQLSWIDLRVFGHNSAGKALYQMFGFEEVGTIVDRFRIDGESIDDVIMTRRVTGNPMA